MPRIPARTLMITALAAMTLAVGATPAQARVRCEPVVADILNRIVSRVTILEGDEVRPVTIAKSATVRSKDYKHVYFVTADLRGPANYDLGIATFATNRITRTLNAVFAIDSVAVAHSDRTVGSASSAHITMVDHGARVARVRVKQPADSSRRRTWRVA
jgi:hypothetical protein